MVLGIDLGTPSTALQRVENIRIRNAPLGVFQLAPRKSTYPVLVRLLPELHDVPVPGILEEKHRITGVWSYVNVSRETRATYRCSASAVLLGTTHHPIGSKAKVLLIAASLVHLRPVEHFLVAHLQFEAANGQAREEEMKH